MIRVFARGIGVVAVICSTVTIQANLIALWQRDYSGNFTATSRVWYFKNLDGSPRTGGGVYPPIEWNTTRTENFPVVYVKNGTATIEVKFMNPQPFSSCSGNFSVNAARLRIPVVGGEGDTYVTLTATVAGSGYLYIPADGGFDTVTMTLTGFPDYVTRGYIQIDGIVEDEAIQYWTSGGYQDWEKTYLTDGTPADNQQKPWTDLLEYACAWAHGEKDIANVATAVTEGMFNEGKWSYDLNTPRFWNEASPTSTNVLYNLTDALGSGTAMDCQDVSGFTMLSMMALGHSAVARRSRRDGSPFTFKTNKLCPMGTDETDPDNYNRVDEFYFHQYAYLGSKVYDASNAQLVDLSGSTFKSVPTGWTLSGYWQTPDGSGGFYGLVFGLANASSPSAVTEDGWARTIMYLK